MAALTRKIHTSVDRTLAPSSASLAQLEGLGVPGLGTWKRGVDLVQFDPAHRDEELRRRLAPEGQVLVGYVGRLAPEKEIELLRHLDVLDGVQVVVVGGGPSEADLRKALPNATFLGMLHGEELGAAYASLDVFVHTGRHETFGQSLQEAMASGVPVIAPEKGGPIDVVDRGAGFLFPPGDGAALTAYVRLLVGDARLRTEIGARARRSVEGRSWHAVNETLVQHYREVIAEHRRTPLRRAS
jgi:phosphatidylinositol alpha 1,6-mannosyltransferase